MCVGMRMVDHNLLIGSRFSPDIIDIIKKYFNAFRLYVRYLNSLNLLVDFNVLGFYCNCCLPFIDSQCYTRLKGGTIHSVISFLSLN
jgi:hypothetical protein